MPYKARIFKGQKLHYQRYYMPSLISLKYLVGKDYNLFCPVCGDSIILGDEIAYLKKQYNPEKLVFHKKCYLKLPKEQNLDREIKSKKFLELEYKLTHREHQEPKPFDLDDVEYSKNFKPSISREESRKKKLLDP